MLVEVPVQYEYIIYHTSTSVLHEYHTVYKEWLVQSSGAKPCKQSASPATPPIHSHMMTAGDRPQKIDWEIHQTAEHT